MMLCGANVRTSQAQAPSLFASEDKTAWWPKTAGTSHQGSTQAHALKAVVFGQKNAKPV